MSIGFRELITCKFINFNTILLLLTFKIMVIRYIIGQKVIIIAINMIAEEFETIFAIIIIVSSCNY